MPTTNQPAAITQAVNRRAEPLIDYLLEEEDARACTDLPDSACRYVPANAVLQIVALTLSKLGDELSNPKTVLAWLLGYVQAPLYLIGLLVPIRESGSLLPQLAIAALIRRLALRKWAWVIGSLVQGACIAGIAASVYTLGGATAGWTIIALLVVFSLARGLCSVAYKDVLGKTIPKRRRGKVSGFAASAAGLIGLAVGLWLALGAPRQDGGDSPAFYALLLAVAALAWLLAALVFALLQEFPGETEGGENGLRLALRKLGLLRDDAPFRRFVVVRSLLLCSALTAPYLVVLANEVHGAGLQTLGLFIIANGLASSLSSPFWGRFADVSSKTVMTRAALMTAGLGIAVALTATLAPALTAQLWFYPLVYFVLGIAHSGARLGRKTYVVDMAGGNKRTDYVAVSNTVIGVVLLATGLVGALAGLISAVGVIVVLSLMGLAGALLGRHLPDV